MDTRVQGLFALMQQKPPRVLKCSAMAVPLVCDVEVVEGMGGLEFGRAFGIEKLVHHPDDAAWVGHHNGSLSFIASSVRVLVQSKKGIPTAGQGLRAVEISWWCGVCAAVCVVSFLSADDDLCKYDMSLMFPKGVKLPFSWFLLDLSRNREERSFSLSPCLSLFSGVLACSRLR